MGEVFRATDTRLGREVAIKVLPQQLSNSPEIGPSIPVLHGVGHLVAP